MQSCLSHKFGVCIQIIYKTLRAGKWQELHILSKQTLTLQVECYAKRYRARDASHTAWSFILTSQSDQRTRGCTGMFTNPLASNYLETPRCIEVHFKNLFGLDVPQRSNHTPTAISRRASNRDLGASRSLSWRPLDSLGQTSRSASTRFTPRKTSHFWCNLQSVWSSSDTCVSAFNPQ